MVGGQAALGVVPMGTANALAADLGLPDSPVKAVKMLLAATPVRISVGYLFYRSVEGGERSRYFIVAAGVGADAFFFSRLDSRLKQRFGYVVYLVEALRLWATYKFPMFTASFTESGRETPREVEASQLLAVRISDFGGLVGKLAPGASISNGKLRVIAFKTFSRVRYLRFLTAVLCGRHRYARTIEGEVRVGGVPQPGGIGGATVCGGGRRALGTLPVRIEVEPQALNLLIPPKTLGRITDL